MPAYLIAEIEVTDLAAFEAYRAQVQALIASYGGKYLIRGGAAQLLEGTVEPHRTVVLEFPTMQQLKDFYSSPEYAPLKAIRLGATRTRMLAVEGV
jgi:uncharacterized protein (DUF1330 family)